MDKILLTRPLFEHGNAYVSSVFQGRMNFMLIIMIAREHYADDLKYFRNVKQLISYFRQRLGD